MYSKEILSKVIEWATYDQTWKRGFFLVLWFCLTALASISVDGTKMAPERGCYTPALLNFDTSAILLIKQLKLCQFKSFVKSTFGEKFSFRDTIINALESILP